ncbi:COG2152 predicted glycoside hydrolase, partial [hydrothermal vent metagenome]
KDGVRIFYRAMGDPDVLMTPPTSFSTIGTAFAEDGVHFNSRRQVIAPSESWEQFGCKDPRATFFEGKWYVFYTALGGFPFGPNNIKVAVAIGDSPEHLDEHHLITPFNAKDATLFPKRINGDIILMLTAHTDWTEEYPYPTIGIARAKKIEDFFDPAYWDNWHSELQKNALVDLRRTEHDHMEVGATPIQTENGWLLIYSYIQNYYDERSRTFGIEAALLDLEDPRNLISRTYPMMVPEEVYEKYGLVPNIVFPSGATIHKDLLELWYGSADTVSAKCSVNLKDLLHALDPSRSSRTLTRAKENPILSPRGNGFESNASFNPTAIDIDGSVHILYRAMDKSNTSTIGYARSKDGIHIDERLDEPIYIPRADFEKKQGDPNGNSGCEDPRISRIGDTIYLTYTACDGVRPPGGAFASISVSDFVEHRFENWSKPTFITPDGIDDKDIGLLSEKINGSYLLYHRVSNRICADLLHDLTDGKRISRCIDVIGPREGMWDSAKVGITGAPLKVSDGWLLIYHGVSNNSHYRLGAALLGEDGITIRARTADPILESVEPYEKDGVINNVVFSCGGVIRDDTLFVYYGGGDRVTGVATGSVNHIENALRNNEK